MIKVHSIESFGVHDGPGIRLVLFMQGCPFRCVYCQNPDTQTWNNPDATLMSAEQVVQRLERARPYFGDLGGLTVSGGEPTLQAEELLTVFRQVRQAGFTIALDTCGAFFNPVVNALYLLSDWVLLDIKHINLVWHKKITGQSNRNPLLNARFARDNHIKLWLRYVLVPGWTDQIEYLEQWAKYFADYNNIDRVEVIGYHTLGVHKYTNLGRQYPLADLPPIKIEKVQVAIDIFSKYLSNVVAR